MGHPPGEIRNNDEHMFNIEKDYKLTDKQYAFVLDSIKTDVKSPPNWDLHDFNCTDWVIEKAALAGIDLPHNLRGENTPADLGQDLANLGADRTPHAGADRGSSDQQDPQATPNMNPLNSLPSIKAPTLVERIDSGDD